MYKAILKGLMQTVEDCTDEIKRQNEINPIFDDEYKREMQMYKDSMKNSWAKITGK